LDIEQTLKLAVEHHQAGRWIEAHKLYKQVLDLHPNEPDALRLMGQLTFASGNSNSAAEMIRRAIELRPHAVDFHIDLARICIAQGNFSQAVASLRRALELDPFSRPEIHFELARALAAVGANGEAITHVETAIKQKPTADALALLGGLLLASNRVQQALDKLHEAVTLAPDRPDLLSTYALALQHRGDFDLAEKNYRHALKLNPDFAEVRNNLGYLLILRRQIPEAIVELKKSIQLKPVYPQAHHNLALAYTGLAQTDDALNSYRTALEQEPAMPDTWEALGRLLLDMRKWKQAITAFNRAIAYRPTAKLCMLLGVAYAGMDDLDGSIAATRKSLELDPRSADAHDTLGGELKWAGDLHAAMAEFDQALKLDPQHRGAMSHRVYAMLMMDDVTPEQILAAHIGCGQQQMAGIVPLRRPRNQRTVDRRLRIGYVSHNFKRQAVTAFVLRILQHHDHEKFEIFCYSDVEVPDDFTKRIQGYADQWREIWQLKDDQVAKQMREDRIDILIELTGHIGKGRLGALAYRPAPIQISYIGYQGTTGMSSVDYVLTDAWADPAGNERFYVEKPYRLPGSYFVYEPPGDAPLVGPLPAGKNGFVTFGCLNAVSKATPRAVAIWSRVMSAVPNSKMILLTTRCKETNERLLAGFAAGGIDSDRVELVQRSGPDVYYRRYNSIDIALDPIPFNGHTTTCDAAWMGCPTVTLSGQIYAHRYGGTVLRNLDLADLVTESEEAYISAAVGLAGDMDRLAMIRSTLRFTMQKSLITDGPKFTVNLENAYRDMWRTWCATGPV
jgi:protein O-GlcNAc transferase